MIEDSNGVSHEFILESEKYIGIKSEKEFFSNVSNDMGNVTAVIHGIAKVLNDIG